MSPAPRPLHGLRVIDFGTAIAGPVCATILGEFGAEVIKVEPPGTGDVLRHFGTAIDDVPLWWMVEGRNKRAITLDLSRPRGQDLARRLAAVADVVVSNFRPGKMERWALGRDDLLAINPRLVYVAVSGFGQTGPYRERPAYDRVAQAMAGLTYLTGHPDQPPVKPGLGVTDYTTAMVAALGAVLALYQRDATPDGRGQLVDAALTETVLRMYHYYLPEYARTGRIPERTGNAAEAMVPAECFQSSDGVWLMVAAGSDGVFARLATALGRPELADNPDYADNQSRMVNADALHGILREWVGDRTSDAVQAALEQHDVPVAPLYTARDIHDDAHYRARGAVTTVEDPVLGLVPMQGVVPRLDRTPGRITSTGPRLGQHNQAVYAELLGLSSAEIATLRGDGII